jgi:hypothetical protein
MNEPALNFDGVTLTPQKETVRVFYHEMWDHADKSLIPKIFHSDFTFRGSLGPTLTGHGQFAGYVDWVTGAFEHYRTDILSLIEEGNRQRQDEISRLPSQGNVRRSAEWASRVVDRHADLHLRRRESARPLCPRRHLRVDCTTQGRSVVGNPAPRPSVSPAWRKTTKPASGTSSKSTASAC